MECFLKQIVYIYLCDLLIKNQVCVWWARSLVNDSYRTDLILMYPPFMIALACIYIASVLKEKDTRSWFEELRVDMNVVCPSLSVHFPSICLHFVVHNSCYCKLSFLLPVLLFLFDVLDRVHLVNPMDHYFLFFHSVICISCTFEEDSLMFMIVECSRMIIVKTFARILLTCGLSVVGTAVHKQIKTIALELLDFYDNYRQIPDERISAAVNKLPQRG